MVSLVTQLPSEGAPSEEVIGEWLASLALERPPEDIRRLHQALDEAKRAHKGQVLVDGMGRLLALLHTADTLDRLKLDTDTLVAAILSEMPGLGGYDPEHVRKHYGESVLRMVEQVSRIRELSAATVHEVQEDIEKLRRLVLDLATDVRSILVLLAKRLRLMRHLKHVSPEMQRQIALETRRIHAPLANRLGVWQLKWELEDLCLRYLEPDIYKDLASKLEGKRSEREAFIRDVVERLQALCRDEGIPAEIVGRPKHIHSIWHKMQQKHLDFEQVYDVRAVRVLVDTVPQCYEVLGMAHGVWRPIPGGFDDYIAHPKANGYQSLHTVLFGPQGIPIEIQIRTREMHSVAEEGIAAHWQYKGAPTGGLSSDAAAEWLRNLLEVQKSSGDSMEFLEHVKVDLFPDEVYVFTPRGKIIVLPKGATVVDFAYAVHSDVGNECVAARVDRHLAPLRTRLHSGQTVEIITRPGSRPNPSWLNYVVTGKARATIRSFLKRLERREAGELGRRLLERELEGLGTRLEHISQEELQDAIKELGHADFAELLQQIGLGNRMARLVARLLVMHDHVQVKEGEASGSLTIQGSEGLAVHFAKCCGPIPGDPVVAIFSPGRGMVVHHQSCPNLGDFRRQGQSWIDVQWADKVEGEFSTAIRVDAGNQRGLLATVATAIAEEGSNIEEVRSDERDGLSTSLRFTIMVRNRKHLAAIFRRIRGIPSVLKVSRLIG